MFPFHIEAQTNTRSTFIEQREKMALNIEKGKMKKVVNSILIYDQFARESINYNLLMVWEQELMLLINGDYKKLINDIEVNERKYYHSRNNRTNLIGFRFHEPPYLYAEQQKGDKFNKAILNYLELNRKQIEIDISHSKLSEEEKSFLIFYLQLSIFYNEECQDRNQDLLGDKAKKFMNKFSDSEYARIVKKYASFKAYQSDWTLGYNATPTGIGVAHTKNEGSHLGTVTNFFHLGVSTSYKNFFIQASGGLSGMSIEDNNIYSNYDLHTDNIGFSGDLTLGYNFHASDFSHTISPFIGIMGTSLTSSIIKPGYMPEEHSLSEFKVGELKMNNRAPYIGINFDFNRNLSTFCYGENLRSRTYNRFQIGVTNKSIPMGANLSEGGYVFLRWTYGIDQETERRVPNF